MVRRLACRGALLTVLVLVLAGPAHGQTREHPLVVDGERIALTTLEARNDAIESRPLTGDRVTVERWVAGEAAARGIVLDEKRVLAEVRPARKADFLFGPRSVAELTPLVARDVLADQVAGALAATAAPRDADGFARAFEDFHASWRARTACRSAWAFALFDRCANQPPRRGDRCRWFGEATVCGRLDRRRAVFDVLPSALFALLAGQPVVHRLDRYDARWPRVRAYLRRHFPAVARRVTANAEGEAVARSRRDAMTVALAVHRVAMADRARGAQVTR